MIRYSLLTVGLFIVVSNQAVFAQDPIYFADDNLKAAVEDWLGVVDPTPTDMLDLTLLEAESLGIQDLTGLEYAINLGGLAVYDNQISDLSPLSGLTDLWGIDLEKNQVSDVAPLMGDSHLLPASACIDAGDPKSPVGLEPEPNAGIINQGVYGGTEQASILMGE